MSERGTDRVRRIVVGADGSAASLRAISWAARRAAEIGGEVIAVHAIQPFWMIDGVVSSEDMSLAYKNWQEDMERVLEGQWCAPLRTTGVAYRSLSVEGGPAALLVWPTESRPSSSSWAAAAVRGCPSCSSEASATTSCITRRYRSW
jgi:hypothetical protein